jgi:DNA-binding XRE family transcriptional regulator
MEMDDWDREKFGLLLWEYRRKKMPGVSQADVGEVLGLQDVTIGRWEKGAKMEPPLRWQVMRLEQFLEVEEFQMLFACRYLPPAKTISVEKLGDSTIVTTIVTVGFLILVVAAAGLHNEEQETYGASTIRIIIVPLDQADELVSAHDFPLSLVG